MLGPSWACLMLHVPRCYPSPQLPGVTRQSLSPAASFPESDHADGTRPEAALQPCHCPTHLHNSRPQAGGGDSMCHIHFIQHLPEGIIPRGITARTTKGCPSATGLPGTECHWLQCSTLGSAAESAAALLPATTDIMRIEQGKSSRGSHRN